MVTAKRKPTLEASGTKACSLMACACVAGFAFTRALYAAAVVLTPGAVPRRLPFGNHAGSLNVDVAALRRLLVDSFDVSAYSCTGERTRRWRHPCVATALLVGVVATQLAR